MLVADTSSDFDGYIYFFYIFISYIYMTNRIFSFIEYFIICIIYIYICTYNILYIIYIYMYIKRKTRRNSKENIQFVDL